MRKLNDRQLHILFLVAQVPGSSTSFINKIDHNRQSYETDTKRRLFTLKQRGLVDQKLDLGKGGHVRARRWYVSPAGHSELFNQGLVK